MVAVLLVIATFVRYGVTANGLAWAGVQAVLVFVAWFDLMERRILNVVIGPVAVVACVLRLLFERDVLLESLVAGVIAFAPSSSSQSPSAAAWGWVTSSWQD